MTIKEIKSTKLLLNDFNTLFVNNKEDVKLIGKVLSNSTRLNIFKFADGRLCRSEIRERLNLSREGLNRHLKVFEDLPDHLKLLNKLKDGKNVYYVKNFDFLIFSL